MKASVPYLFSAVIRSTQHNYHLPVCLFAFFLSVLGNIPQSHTTIPSEGVFSHMIGTGWLRKVFLFVLLMVFHSPKTDPRWKWWLPCSFRSWLFSPRKPCSWPSQEQVLAGKGDGSGQGGGKKQKPSCWKHLRWCEGPLQWKVRCEMPVCVCVRMRWGWGAMRKDAEYECYIYHWK